MNLFSKYLEERQGTKVITSDVGFATYKQIDDETVYLIDIFVEKEHRRKGLASQLSLQVQIEAERLGCTKLLGSVDITANGVTNSLKAVLADGFEFSHGSGNVLYFIKNI